MAKSGTGKISRKEAAVSFLQLASSGKVKEAYQTHIASNFRHHNPYLRIASVRTHSALNQTQSK